MSRLTDVREEIRSGYPTQVCLRKMFCINSTCDAINELLLPINVKNELNAVKLI